MQNTEFFKEIETHKILWDFAMKTDYLIPARRPELEMITKKKTKKKKQDLLNGGF